MLRWALIFLVVALVAGLLGFTSIVGPAMAIAKLLFYVFVVLFLISLVMHLVRGGQPSLRADGASAPSSSSGARS